MEIHGRECGFMLTVGASVEISKLCPNGDMARIGEMFDGTNYAEMMDFVIKFAVALNKGYEENKAVNEDGYTERVLTEKELRALPPSALMDIQREAMAAFTRTAEPSVEVKTEKKTETAAAH